ncbi:MAG: pyrroline-5-carboxylate reductase [Firmicutes bacterium]|nr:pyrroline-5-carboxylate reductase [Bacillota bacterium]
MSFKYKLGFIGFGNMANVIYDGIVLKGVVKNKEIAVFDTDIEKLEIAKNKKICVLSGNAEIVENCKYVVFAVKPQSAYEIFKEIAPSDNIIISIMAGITKAKLAENLQNCKIVRCMPNTPSLIGLGMTAIDCNDLENIERKFVLSVFSSIGKTVELEDKYMDAVTAVSGSGPAYVYTFIDALIEAGISLGLDEDTSKLLTLQTVVGAYKMVQNTKDPIQNLTDAVCSKGGTTAEAIKVLADADFKDIVKKAVAAAYNRSVELSKI